MKQINDKEYAAYMLANYTLGYIDTALFIGANLFERYFKTMVSEQEAYRELRKTEKIPTLYHYIESYVKYKYKQDVIFSQTDNLISDLHKFRNLRNNFVHEMNENNIIQKKIEIGKFILYIYFSYNKDQVYDSAIIHESTNNILLQDYKIKEITERMISRMEREKIGFNSEIVKNFKGIKKNDFNNLFGLRKKLRYLQRHLENELSETVGLIPTILSPINTTSAYVWMPFVDKDFTDNVNKLNTQRNNLILGSTSILATPVDFRIYIDFGGGDYEYRLAFQDFLQSEKFITYIERFRDKIHPLEIFDIRWYSFIINRHKLFDVLDQKIFLKMAQDAKKMIEIDKQEKNIVASGYNRIGFILPACDMGKDEIILLFKEIAHIYYEFLRYKFKNDTDVDILKEAQNALFD